MFGSKIFLLALAASTVSAYPGIFGGGEVPCIKECPDDFPCQTGHHCVLVPTTGRCNLKAACIDNDDTVDSNRPVAIKNQAGAIVKPSPYIVLYEPLLTGQTTNTTGQCTDNGVGYCQDVNQVCAISAVQIGGETVSWSEVCVAPSAAATATDILNANINQAPVSGKDKEGGNAACGDAPPDSSNCPLICADGKVCKAGWARSVCKPVYYCEKY